MKKSAPRIVTFCLISLFLLIGLGGCAAGEGQTPSAVPSTTSSESVPPSEAVVTPPLDNDTATPSPVSESRLIPRENNASRFEMADLVVDAYAYGSERRLVEESLGAPLQEDNMVWDANGEAHDTLYYDGVTFDFVREEDADKATAKLCAVTVTDADYAGPRGLRVGLPGQEALDKFYVGWSPASVYEETFMYYAKTLEIPVDGSAMTVYLAPSGLYSPVEDGRIELVYRVPETPYASQEEEEAYSYIYHGNLSVTIGPDGLVESYLWWVGADAE